MPITIPAYISHIRKNANGEIEAFQSNEEHCHGVAALAERFANEFGMGEWGKVLGLLHDKGKERAAFQQYIRYVNGLPSNNIQHYDNHHHSYAGGLLADALMGKDVINLLVNQIISHHTELHDDIDVEDCLRNSQLPTEIDSCGIAINRTLLAWQLQNLLSVKAGKEMTHFHHLSRMLFSCLIDADRLDTEHFMDIETWKRRGSSSSIADLLPRLETHLDNIRSNAPDTEVNRIRRLVQDQCCKASSCEQGFYSLTVPTEGGKTLASVLWAMRHAVHHGMNRIIIAIPYTSIIVQTAGVLKSIFGEENVLEHHSNFDPDNIKNDEIREKTMLATENWDYPIIVTTNVQLFESIFSNKPAGCRKLHNVVNSVIILDEVQTLPTDFLQPIIDAMKAYQCLFGTSLLFTTASQPVLSGLIKGTNPMADFKGIEHIREIISGEFALHDRLRRVELEIENEGKTYDEIADKIAQHPKVLCIVNTRKDAKELYGRLPDEGIRLHLSRMMCPAHIDETIQKIKDLSADKSQPTVRVIATQLVEAGVDIDFPVVFRQEAGLDSILQAAGRCNREGKNAMGHTFVFSLSAEHRVPFGSIRDANNARLSLPAHSDWFAPSTMREYFLQFYARNTFDKQGIKYHLYNYRDLHLKTASKKFKLIDDDCVNVIINWRNSTDFVAKLKESGCTYHLMKQLAKFTVGVHRSDFNKLVGYGAVEELLEGVYFLPDRAQYNDITGLQLDNHWIDEILMI